MSFDQNQITISIIDDQIGNLIRDRISKYGVCIINNVLNDQECSNLFYGLSNSLSYATSRMDKPFNISDIQTWNTIKNLTPTKGMIFQHWGLGHSQALWDIRCNPKIINIYNSFYGLPNNSNELIVSFDAFSFLCPPEVTNSGKFFKESWYHFDQSRKRPEFETLQGWVSATDTNEGDGTLSVMIYSHLLHSRSLNLGDDKGDFIMMDEHKDLFKQYGCIEHKVTCPHGSLVLWDSRLLHYGSLPILGRANPNFRVVAYVCYAPRQLLTEKYKKNKQKSLTERNESMGFLRTTNHHPFRPKLFSKIPFRANREFDKIIVPLPDPQIPNEFKFLTGF